MPAAGEAMGSPAAWNAWIVGIAIAAVAVWAVAWFAPWQDWVNGVLGAWLVIAPWVLGFGSLAAAAWNHVIVGLLVLALAAWELWDVRQRATAWTGSPAGQGRLTPLPAPTAVGLRSPLERSRPVGA